MENIDMENQVQVPQCVVYQQQTNIQEIKDDRDKIYVLIRKMNGYAICIMVTYIIILILSLLGLLFTSLKAWSIIIFIIDIIGIALVLFSGYNSRKGSKQNDPKAFPLSNKMMYVAIVIEISVAIMRILQTGDIIGAVLIFVFIIIKLFVNVEINNLYKLDENVFKQAIGEQCFKDQIIEFNSLKTLQSLAENDRKIVKLEAMIQDVSENEIVTSLFINKQKFIQNSQNSVHFNLFQQNTQTECNEFEEILCDRQLIHAVPVPYSSQNPLEDLSQNNQNNNAGDAVKIPKTDIEITSQMELGQLYQRLSGSKIFNFDGTMGVSQFPCVLNLYNLHENKIPKMQDIIEIYGVLNFELEQKNDSMQLEEEEEQFEDFDAESGYTSQYPVQVIPRIDVLHFQIKQNTIENKIQSLQSQIQQNTIQDPRAFLLDLLTEICLGDEVVAHYVLISMIANTFIQKDGINFGKMCINLFKIPDQSFTYQLDDKELTFSQVVMLLCQAVVPFMKYIPLSIPYLSQTHFSCNKNMETEQLENGVLFLPYQQTKPLLVVDETYMETGTLGEQGVKNVLYINTLLDSQALVIQNEYFKTSLDANVSALILSEGKSFIYHDFKVCFDEKKSKGKHILSESAANILLRKDENMLNQLQYFIMQSRQRIGKVDFSETAKECVNQDYVSERAKQREQEQQIEKSELITPDTLQLWVQLTKINAASSYFLQSEKSEIDSKEYEFVRNLEKERLLRLQKVNKKN